MQPCTHTVQLRKPSCTCIWQILSASSSASLLCCACSHNCLKALVPEVWSLSSLKSLKLDHNQLTIVPEEIGNLKRLEELVSMPVVRSCMQLTCMSCGSVYCKIYTTNHTYDVIWETLAVFIHSFFVCTFAGSACTAPLCSTDAHVVNARSVYQVLYCCVVCIIQ